MNNGRVVIIGGGFAGLTVAKTLERNDVQVTVIDSRNYYLFQPLLYQVATGDLHAEAVATPIRRLLRGKKAREAGNGSRFPPAEGRRAWAFSFQDRIGVVLMDDILQGMNNERGYGSFFLS